MNKKNVGRLTKKGRKVSSELVGFGITKANMGLASQAITRHRSAIVWECPREGGHRCSAT